MAEALRLAARALWTAHPNPRVGCVIARGDDVVGRGWHERAGQPHAEVHALADAGERARGATAYVTLEPCSHQGRTPPCADALIEAGVARVVAALVDPFPDVAGRGLERLAAAGIRVARGLMEGEARALNPGFLSRIERGRPYVRLKLAGSLDGRSNGPDGASKWITGDAARRDGHRWRARADAILTGIGTVVADDPAMNVRLEGVEPSSLPPKPVVVLDPRGRLPANARLFDTGNPVWRVGTGTEVDDSATCERLEVAADPAGRADLEDLLRVLAARDINELHVEAGPTLSGALLCAGLVDELLVYQAPTLVGSGSPTAALPGVEKLADRLHLVRIDTRAVGDDLRIRLRPAEASRTSG
ncbi:bifunctional diaminohydroxyphosphoribosylaminopyrimidine deaminase/5-amino-6-(5-phosphoribosylamino)uracil reductase RibD [Halomonas denitrificans]|nr:bifunctional diaminohydroxyphosphoribosylaminopyrimidine deaminase/5-amino-6-(5-phosphoribosylamino)uracil reductase RibD [Halomonas denitrificans]